MSSYASPPSFSASNTTAASATPANPSLPPDLSPSSLDTLPVITAILTRLTSNASNSSNNASSTTPPPAQPSQAQTQSQFDTSPLSSKDIPAATDALKGRLQKARKAVKELPDVSRSLEEQEEEIRELEAKIAEQRKVLEVLRERGLAQSAPDTMDT